MVINISSGHKGDNMNELQFPGDFKFGTATASYQIEGAWNRDGKGESIWDTFSHTSGKIKNNQTGDRACDHYNLYAKDVEIMKSLGLETYRLSLSWPRIMPQGTGSVNQKGIDFYSRLIDELLQAGITPFVTLFHWDLPQALQDRFFGFESRQCSDHFAEYAEAAVRALGDRVKNWITLNEIQMHGMLGYFMGEHAPGRVRPWKYLNVMHNLLLAHGKGLQTIRSVDSEAKVGAALNIAPVHPATDKKKDIEAATLAQEFFSGITLDPIFKGTYPEEMMKRLRIFRPDIRDGDMEIISSPCDFLGINNYTRERVMYKWYIPFLKSWVMDAEIADGEFVRDGVQHTAMGWEVYPESIYEAIMIAKRAAGSIPLYITENGAAYDDQIEGGRVKDEKRIDFLKKYLGKVREAIDDGANVKGYFCWTFMDNFEWGEGFDKRFGLVHVDHDTQKRTIKESGYWYRDLIKSQEK